MFAFSLFLTDSWYIIFYLFIVFASFLCSMYLLLCGYITFKCLNKVLGYFCTFLHAYTSLHLTPHNYTHWLHQFYRVCPSSTNVAGWVVVRVMVTKSTGERNKWQDMSLKVSQFYFAYCNIQLTKPFFSGTQGYPNLYLVIPDLWSCQFVR